MLSPDFATRLQLAIDAAVANIERLSAAEDSVRAAAAGHLESLLEQQRKLLEFEMPTFREIQDRKFKVD